MLLALPNFTRSFTIECNAFGMGVGAILMQKGKHIAYYSRG
jgi:hypothetical protein